MSLTVRGVRKATLVFGVVVLDLLQYPTYDICVFGFTVSAFYLVSVIFIFVRKNGKLYRFRTEVIKIFILEVFAMKTKTKAIALTLCAVLLVVASVMGTMAYLTSKDTVTNTFTVGNVSITLDEAKVDKYGTVDSEASRVKANSYDLVPGHTYTKDPTVTVAANSEPCYVFVEVENGLSAYEATNNTIVSQITTTNGWTALDGETGVYYKKVAAANTDTPLVVFSSFTLSDTANSVDGWNSLSSSNISVKAYAIQQDGFETPAAAWEAVKD